MFFARPGLSREVTSPGRATAQDYDEFLAQQQENQEELASKEQEYEEQWHDSRKIKENTQT